MMVDSDLALARRERLLADAGEAPDYEGARVQAVGRKRER
jgi:hypothetical protein